MSIEMRGEYVPSRDTLRKMFDTRRPERMCLRNVHFKSVGAMKNTPILRCFPKEVEHSERAKLILQSYMPEASNKRMDELIQNTHRSVATIQTQFDGINKYVDRISQMPPRDIVSPSLWRVVLHYMERILLSQGRLKPLCVDSVLTDPCAYLSEPGASAGYPYINRMKHAKRDVVNTEEFKDEYIQFLHTIMLADDPLRYREKCYPCVAYQKTSVVKPGKEEKVRFIWGYPLLMTLTEALFSHPLIEHCGKLEDTSVQMFTSFRFTPYSDSFTKMMDRFDKAPTMVIDYSNYDSSVPEWVLNDIFDLVLKMFICTPEEKKIFRAVQHYFIHTPIVLSSGTMFVKHHGIPSGSWFTNIIGSLANAAMMLYANFSASTKPMIMKVMGDDNLTIGGRTDKQKMAKQMKEWFGVEINDKKCYTGKLTGAKYLGRKFDTSEKSFKGWKKDIVDSCLSLLFPGRRDTDDYMWQRFFAIYLDNPVMLIWKIVDHYRQDIINAFRKEFEVNENREMVFTVFHGDYKAAKELVQQQGVERFLVPPSRLERLL